jgi:hypothetical protein
MKQHRFKIWMLIPLVLLTACKPEVVALSTIGFDPLSYFDDPVNMMQKNYATADYLSERAKGFVKTEHTIQAQPLQDFQEPRIITHFGKDVPMQVGQRLIQLGYNVDLTPVWTQVNDVYDPIAHPSIQNPDFILTGSYGRKTSTLDVTVRIVDARTGIERASYSYTIPRKDQLRKDTTPKPVIQKTTPAGAN